MASVHNYRTHRRRRRVTDLAAATNKKISIAPALVAVGELMRYDRHVSGALFGETEF